MAEYNAYTKALDILKKRENHWGMMAGATDNYTTKMSNLSMASAYNSAWWILYYAMHEDWESLDQFDYYEEIESNDN